MDKAYSGTSAIGVKKVGLEMAELDNEGCFKISNHDAMRPFFMSIVSHSNHWMFISSNGGLTAGRRNAEYALFPYYTEDKITDLANVTGSKTIFRVRTENRVYVWEPFSGRIPENYAVTRNLYKSIYDNKIVFEEINHDLGLIFRYQWNTSEIFGFVRGAELKNVSDHNYEVTLVDGLQNIMPYGVPSYLQRSTSNLVDAYKRSELEPDTGMGIYALSAIIVDKAEPSEALKANVVWSLGLENPQHLLSSLQLDDFRTHGSITAENDVKGEKGAYFLHASIPLESGSGKTWKIIADVNQTHSQVVALRYKLKSDAGLESQIRDDIDLGTEKLVMLVASADGLQFTADKLNDSRHYSNVLFNIMRGGIFDHHYGIRKEDFVKYLFTANKKIATESRNLIHQLPDEFSLFDLEELVMDCGNADLTRLAVEYLPLKFSRRHGDPSRPWNYFTINIQNENDGSGILDYEGNWRDIFQNWEALAQSYPEFIGGMIFKFLNASTFDGYNPYRVTKDGFDWETIEPDNPWSYIGYWGDHQIIYLQKFFEIIEKYHPGELQSFFDKDWFVYAAVPYKLKPYGQLLKNPKDTIEFDHAWDSAIRQKREVLGADGALLSAGGQEIYHVNFIEKVLATLLAKLSNFIPEAGIWMNTQRPEWNDANNALVGNGVSMVTLCYLHRFLKFFDTLLVQCGLESVTVSAELKPYYEGVVNTLNEYSAHLTGRIDDHNRKKIVDLLGQAASDYRQHIYQSGFRGEKESIGMSGLKSFVRLCLNYTEHSIRANQRPDKLYHSYNLMTATESGISVSHLSEMLEGQVAVLSSGYLSPEQSLEVLDALRNSPLFRPDQYSYILYPNKRLPGFLEKNQIPADRSQKSELIQRLIQDGNRQIVDKDIEGGLHFNGNFKNVGDLEQAISKLSESKYGKLVEKDRSLVMEIFEEVFNHKAFTGRSGTFYSYEGLGSIYWHMVSKLHLAVQESCLRAMHDDAGEEITGRLLDHYDQIEAGIGVHKSPGLYGAFPTDPYSHTPMHRGAQQPGMTGQVKEDILVRFAELGMSVNQGELSFNPTLLRKSEFAIQGQTMEYRDLGGHLKKIELKGGQLAFTCCQTPVVYTLSDKESITLHYSDGRKITFEGLRLKREGSSAIFRRTGELAKVEVSIDQKRIR